MTDIKRHLKIIELSIEEICETTECNSCPILKVCTDFDEFKTLLGDKK